MTHGEEPDPETHQDSAVLTYLEGLLMHPVAAGPVTTATRTFESVNNNAESGKHGTAGVQLPDHASSPPDTCAFPGAASRHLKKARLLRPGTWTDTDQQKKDVRVAGPNGLDGELPKAEPDTSNQGESTLLASLLQSFSSRLQTVAMSQHSAPSLRAQDGECSEDAHAGKVISQSYGSASNRLKGLMRKNKQQSHKNVPYSHRGSRERCAESPSLSQVSASDAVSCAERLKAVASLVKNRSSPAPSPKPSIACSQLALLLSSEAHLQQYSREQALKAQSSGRTASERLAAMATQQINDARPASVGKSGVSQDILSPFNVSNGTLPSPTLKTNNRCPFQNLGQSVTTSSPQPAPHHPKEKRPFDRQNNRPPPNCSSLLLLLLNNHNTRKDSARNGHREIDCAVDSSQASSHQSDSEYSNQENNVAKDSSDAESCYSSCSPIDLSMRGRVYSQRPEVPSSALSLDKLTETLLNSWRPDTPGPKIPEVSELETSPDFKSHHKVTLMQLLQDRKNNERTNNITTTKTDGLDLHPHASVAGCSVKPAETSEESRMRTSLQQLMDGRRSTSFLTEAPSKTPTPPHHPYSSPVIQSSPLDLCKPKPQTSEMVMEPNFTASKLLQNLAQCGLQNQSALSQSSPSKVCRPPSKRRSPEPEFERSQSFPDAPVAPTTVFQPPQPSFTPFTNKRSPSSSGQIENLLERRNVLQLLLGNASQREKSAANRSTESDKGNQTEPPVPVSCNSSNGPSLHVKVKTEPCEESPLSDGLEDGRLAPASGRQGHSLLAKAHEGIKEEPCPTEVIHKYGLLSQLLKQKTTTYHSGPCTDPPKSTFKEDPQDYPDPVLLPKKRRVCLELAEHLSKELCQRPSDPVSERLTSNRTPDLNHSRALVSPKEEEPFTRSHGSKPPSRDSQGFNVLKQLLLSDNCLKELPQPQSITSPVLSQASYKANGNFSQPNYNQNLVTSPWFSSNSGPGHLKPLLSLPGNSNQGSPWARASPQANPKSLKTENTTWSPVVESKCEANRDSPPLTRSNPILYYMLQKNSQLRKELDVRTQRTHCGVKVDPCMDGRFHTSSLNAVSDIQRRAGTHEHELIGGQVEKF